MRSFRGYVKLIKKKKRLAITLGRGQFLQTMIVQRRATGGGVVSKLAKIIYFIHDVDFTEIVAKRNISRITNETLPHRIIHIHTGRFLRIYFTTYAGRHIVRFDVLNNCE